MLGYTIKYFLAILVIILLCTNSCNAQHVDIEDSVIQRLYLDTIPTKKPIEQSKYPVYQPFTDVYILTTSNIKYLLQKHKNK